jgi:SAM-dependent methyltransferase
VSPAEWPGEFHRGGYQAQFDRLAASGQDLHGEATFVRAYSPTSVLAAGCGTGRVAIELARHGIEVVGTDIDDSMLATAQRLAPDIEWVRSDLCELKLGRTFDLVVMAGNVPLFTPPGTEAALVAGVARHVAAGGPRQRVQPAATIRCLSSTATAPTTVWSSRTASPPGTASRGSTAATMPCRSTGGNDEHHDFDQVGRAVRTP